MEVGPYHGEFGLKVRWWVPQVHALATTRDVRVLHEPGEECLFPLAAERGVVGFTGSHAERARRGRPPTLGYGEARFRPRPHVCQGVGEVDVVVAPRRSDYGASKNWERWPEVTAHLRGAGFQVTAAGTQRGSYDVPPPRTWDYARVLDATIEAMGKARVVVATDAGLAHLAVLCGVPLILVTYRGRVAPGPVVDSRGRVAAEEYWPVRLREYYENANYMGVPIQVVDGWEEPEAVAEGLEAVLTWSQRRLRSGTSR